MPALLGFVSPPRLSSYWLHRRTTHDLFIADWLERGSIKHSAEGAA